MKNIRRLGKIALILLGVVCLGFSISGCSGPSTVMLYIILQLVIINTILLIAGFVYLIWFKK